MRVFVTSIDDSVQPPRVRLDSELGEFEAQWRGRDAPALGETFVEVDVDDDLEWGVDVVSDPGAQPRLATVGDETVITGVVEQVPLDGPTVLAVGPTTVWLDVEGDPPLGIVDTTATATVRQVSVSPMNL